uniref:Replication protein A subunit n=1 Tax=Ornithodoros turicata TaxID=34597 RepID=A0A2R5LE87_9ACAR
MGSPLTGGAVQRILDGELVDKPVLQVLNFKPIPGGSSERYRLLLSDGVMCHTYAMLGTQLNEKITSKEVEKFAVIQLDKYMCNTVNPEKKILIILELTVVAAGADVGSKIGNPVTNVPGVVAQQSAQAQQNVSAPAEAAAPQRPQQPTQFQFRGNTSSMSAPQRPQMSTGGSLQQTNGVVVFPISSLTPYQNKWTIRARVTNKSAIRTWSNSKGEGKLFSMDLLDESGEIRATAFNAECDRFYDVIEVNKVYYVSKANLKPANKNFTSIKNEFEMSFNSETHISPCDDSSSIPTVQFSFVPILKLQGMPRDTLVDVIGVCKSAGEVQTVIRRNTNQELKKRDIQLVDKTNTEISLTLWGTQAETFEAGEHPVVAIKGARISDFSGVSLSLIGSSMMQVNPDLPESHSLYGWYVNEGSSMESQSITVRGGAGGSLTGPGTVWKSLEQVKKENLGQGDKPDYFTTKASIAIVRKEKCLYKACPTEQCNKKVVDMENGFVRCEKCAQEFSNYKWRLLVSANLADFSDSQWVTCFGKEAEQLLGASAEELGSYFEMNNPRFEDIISDAAFKEFIFRLRVKMETYNDETRLKTSVVSLSPVNYVEHTQKLLKDIESMS